MRSAEDETMTDYDPYEGRTRDQYLRDLAEENGVPLHMVRLAADMLGPDEDFDDLVTTVEDLADEGEFDD